MLSPDIQQEELVKFLWGTEPLVEDENSTNKNYLIKL